MELMTPERTPTPEELAAFHSAVANKASKQATQAFLMTQAMKYLQGVVTNTSTRKQRRLIARDIAKRLAKKVAAG